MSFSENLLRTNNPTQPSDYFEYITIIIDDLKQVTSDFKAYVFGSVANKTSREDSDLDILFIFPNTADIKEIRRKFLLIKRNYILKLIWFLKQKRSSIIPSRY